MWKSDQKQAETWERGGVYTRKKRVSLGGFPTYGLFPESTSTLVPNR